MIIVSKKIDNNPETNKILEYIRTINSDKNSLRLRYNMFSSFSELTIDKLIFYNNFGIRIRYYLNYFHFKKKPNAPSIWISIHDIFNDMRLYDAKFSDQNTDLINFDDKYSLKVLKKTIDYIKQNYIN